MCAQTFFFANFGPNATTFITPVELFTTKYRSSLHGISAACGKHHQALSSCTHEITVSEPHAICILQCTWPLTAALLLSVSLSAALWLQFRSVEAIVAICSCLLMQLVLVGLVRATMPWGRSSAFKIVER